jgi:hypothetical protein
VTCASWRKKENTQLKSFIRNASLQATLKPYHTPDNMYLINPPLVTAKGRIFRGNAKHLRCGARNNFNAFGNKTNTIIKNENAWWCRAGLTAIKHHRVVMFKKWNHRIAAYGNHPQGGRCARRLIAAIGRGWLIKPKTAFGRVKHGTAPLILPLGFAACISHKDDTKKCPLFAAGVWARIVWVPNFAVLLKT